jgi:FXSXX-COOH protein
VLLLTAVTEYYLSPNTGASGKLRENLSQQAIKSAIPDLRELPLDRLAELGDSVLANSIALYRQRLTESGLPLSSFNSGI